MINLINDALTQTRDGAQAEIETQPQLLSSPRVSGFGKGATPLRTPPADLQQIGRELLKRQQGEAFATHYHTAVQAAGALQGKEFLREYRALKRVAREQGMPEAEFRRFEMCLYRHFYRAAALDTVRARQSGLRPKVEPDELAYIAKIADIPEDQIRRDSFTFQRAEFMAQILALKTRNKGSTV